MPADEAGLRAGGSAAGCSTAVPKAGEEPRRALETARPLSCANASAAQQPDRVSTDWEGSFLSPVEAERVGQCHQRRLRRRAAPLGARTSCALTGTTPGLSGSRSRQAACPHAPDAGMAGVLHGLCFHAGANSIFYGPRLLMTPNSAAVSLAGRRPASRRSVQPNIKASSSSGAPCRPRRWRLRSAPSRLGFPIRYRSRPGLPR